MRIGSAPLLVAAAVAVVLGACGGSSAAGGAPSATPSADPLSGSITVLAASSLTSAFNTAEKALEAAHPGFKAMYSYGGSQTLVTQVVNGAPADVIATANTTTMAQLVTKGLAETPVAFCRNELEIAVAPGNPLHITGIADLTRPGLAVVIGDPSVPVGQYAAKVLSTGGIHLTPRSLQLSDAAVLEQLESGDADAALVFVTDVIGAAGKVTGVPIPAAQNDIGTYEIAALVSSANQAAARAFVTEAVSGSVQAQLRTAGFLAT